MLRDKREYEVELIVTSRHLITTYSRTPEEAESDAEDLFEDGERGTVMSYEVEQSEAYPLDEDINSDEDNDEDNDEVEDE